jgi:hypothetical protein
MPKGVYKHTARSGFRKGNKLGLGNKWRLGKPQSEETRLKISNTMKGRPSNTLGKHHTEETKLKMSLMRRGDKHPNWLGGKSFELYPVDWQETLKRSIRERDKYVCRICLLSQGDIAHDVHHIDYDKKNCNPENLITLCHSCHSKTNHKRELWIKFFNSFRCPI